MNEMCFGEHSYRNHQIGILSGYSYEMTSNTATFFECSRQSGLAHFRWKVVLDKAVERNGYLLGHIWK